MNTKYKKGMTVKVKWMGFECICQIHDVRTKNGKNYYLVYWRESDGAFPNWKSESSIIEIVDHNISSDQELFESVNYPGCMEPKDSYKTKEQIQKEANGLFEHLPYLP